MDANLTFESSGRKSNAPRRTASRRGTTSAVRVLGLCGLLSAALSAAAGFLDAPTLLGPAGVTMVVGNVYAIVGGRPNRRSVR